MCRPEDFGLLRAKILNDRRIPGNRGTARRPSPTRISLRFATLARRAGESEYLQSKYSIVPDLLGKSRALSDPLPRAIPPIESNVINLSIRRERRPRRSDRRRRQFGTTFWYGDYAPHQPERRGRRSLRLSLRHCHWERFSFHNLRRTCGQIPPK